MIHLWSFLCFERRSELPVLAGHLLAAKPDDDQYTELICKPGSSWPDKPRAQNRNWTLFFSQRTPSRFICGARKLLAPAKALLELGPARYQSFPESHFRPNRPGTDYSGFGLVPILDPRFSAKPQAEPFGAVFAGVMSLACRWCKE